MPASSMCTGTPHRAQRTASAPSHVRPLTIEVWEMKLTVSVPSIVHEHHCGGHGMNGGRLGCPSTSQVTTPAR